MEAISLESRPDARGDHDAVPDGRDLPRTDQRLQWGLQHDGPLRLAVRADPDSGVADVFGADHLRQRRPDPERGGAGSGQPLTETWTPSSSSSTGGVWSQQAPPAGVNTLFLSTPTASTTPTGNRRPAVRPPGVNDVLQQLTTTIDSGAGGMVGAIVPVEGDPQTAADYTRLGRQPVFGPGRQPGGERHQRHGAQPRGCVSRPSPTSSSSARTTRSPWAACQTRRSRTTRPTTPPAPCPASTTSCRLR